MRASLNALVVTSLANINYLTNFSGSAATVVLTSDVVYFLTDSRYTHDCLTEPGGARARALDWNW